MSMAATTNERSPRAGDGRVNGWAVMCVVQSCLIGALIYQNGSPDAVSPALPRPRCCILLLDVAPEWVSSLLLGEPREVATDL